LEHQQVNNLSQLALNTNGSPLTHEYWWTCIPALPTGRESHTYRMLKRVWFDHTMNTFRVEPDGTLKPNGRNFYTAGKEDHITPALFQTFAMFEDHSKWLPQSLELFGIETVGRVASASWSYLFEEIYEGRKFCIADIVLSWRDDAGEAVLVLEVKAPKGSLTAKDIDGLGRYLNMLSVRKVSRRSIGFLVDASDLPRVRAVTKASVPAASWQDMIRLQVEATKFLPCKSDVQELIAALILEHAAYCGIHMAVTQPRIEIDREVLLGLGNTQSYDRIVELGLPLTIQNFLLGSEAALAVRQGHRPQPPMSWLSNDPRSVDIWNSSRAGDPRRQSVPDRRVAFWRSV
jgi:hypothetical protein